MPENNISLTKEDLKQILSANAEMLKEVIQELKKPSPEEEQKAEALRVQVQQDAEMRKEQGAQVLHKINNERAIQRICSHKHRDGNSHCVFVMEANSPGYLLCQKNQCKIRPGVAPKGYKGGDIYDNDLFNRLFQEIPSNELFQ